MPNGCFPFPNSEINTNNQGYGSLARTRVKISEYKTARGITSLCICFLSISKWTIFPKEFELIFIHGPNYIDRIETMTSYKVWLNVPDALRILSQSNSI